MPFRRFLFTIGLVLIAGTSSILPLETFAVEDTCNCYCTSPTGAQSVPDATTKVTQTNCQERCTDKGQTVAAFACTANQHPSRSLNCFNAEQCAEVGGELGKKYQPPECPNGYFYCYADPSKAIKATLSTSIGGLTVTGDLGEYVASAYKWMLGASTTLAIVFLMVAGLRWTLGGLSAEQIGKAQKTIQNALVGLVLLMSTYLILATINPQLLKLKLPSFPKIKIVSLVGNASCDELKREGYSIDYSGPEECGTVGTVTKDPEGKNVPDGVVCNFSYCAKPMAICVPGEKPTCMTCEELSYDNKVVPVTESLCSAFNSEPEFQQDRYQKSNELRTWNYCFFSYDGDANGSYAVGGCARIGLDCNNINTCSDYDNVPVYTSSKKPSMLDDIDVGAGSGIVNVKDQTIFTSFLYTTGVTLGSFCNQSSYADLCKWHRTSSGNYPLFGGTQKTCGIDSTDLNYLNIGALEYITPKTYDCQAE